MPFNLLRERWLPVIRADGTRDVIAPWQLAAGPSPPVDLAPPRPDFRAALLEFLIGLLQTACPPEKYDSWRQFIRNPPAQDQLRAAMEPFAPYFELVGDRPLFMQDLELPPPAKPADANRIDQLLIDAPGNQSLRLGTDFFVKRGGVDALCPACAAMALYTLQAFAPSGGKGHRTSLRGGGPLSTLVHGETLWQAVWLNVLPITYQAHGVQVRPVPPSAELPGKVFPWAAPTRTSPQGEQVHPGDVHFLHTFWAMPRRVLLLPEEAREPVACSLCGAASRTVFRRYVTKSHGNNYGDTWRHPLTPYRRQGPGKAPFSVKGAANVTGYTHWLGVVYGQAGDERGKIMRALCVDNALGRLDNEVAVAVAGYDMDNMKPLQWCEGRFPVVRVPDDRMEDFRFAVEDMVLAADAVSRNLVACLKEALAHESARKAATVDKTLLANVSSIYWGRTEPLFYALARKLAEADDDMPLRKDWAKVLEGEALMLFDEQTGRFRLLPTEIRRQVEARRKLANFNRKALERVLQLPVQQGG